MTAALGAALAAATLGAPTSAHATQTASCSSQTACLDYFMSAARAYAAHLKEPFSALTTADDKGIAVHMPGWSVSTLNGQTGLVDPAGDYFFLRTYPSIAGEAGLATSPDNAVQSQALQDDAGAVLLPSTEVAGTNPADRVHFLVANVVGHDEGRATASLVGSDLGSYTGAGGVTTQVVSGPAGGPWTLQFVVDPTATAWAVAQGCTVTMSAADATHVAFDSSPCW